MVDLTEHIPWKKSNNPEQGLQVLKQIKKKAKEKRPIEVLENASLKEVSPDAHTAQSKAEELKCMLLRDVSQEERAFRKQAESLSESTDHDNEAWRLPVEVNLTNKLEIFMSYLPTAIRKQNRKSHNFSSITLGYLHAHEGSRKNKYYSTQGMEPPLSTKQ